MERRRGGKFHLSLSGSGTIAESDEPRGRKEKRHGVSDQLRRVEHPYRTGCVLAEFGSQDARYDYGTFSVVVGLSVTVHDLCNTPALPNGSPGKASDPFSKTKTSKVETLAECGRKEYSSTITKHSIVEHKAGGR